MTRINDSEAKPAVSVLLATRNEEAFIAASLTSLLQQQVSGFDLEILVIDGVSSDRTLQIVAEVSKGDPRVRVVTNFDEEIPFAWNLGLQAAKGEYICTLGAHCIYAPDYISLCLAELISKRAVACGGRAIAVCAQDSVQARLCTWILKHPFGSSPRSFRTQPEGFVDSPAYPIFLKSAIVSVGGYDQNLHRNEDNDMSRKLRAAGGKLYCTWKTQCYYFGKNTLPELLRYSFRNGRWNAIGLRKNLRTMSIRHFVPLGFVMALFALLIASLTRFSGTSEARLLFLALIFIHLTAGLLSGLKIAIHDRKWEALSLPLFFLGFHLAYGTGTAWGFGKMIVARRRLQHAGIKPRGWA